GGGFSQTAALTLTLPTGASPSGLAVGDFNNHTLPDLAASNAGTDNVTVFLNGSTAGAIAFDAGTNFSVGAGTGPVAIVAGKFDADTNTDLAVVAGKPVAGHFNLVVLTGDGNGAFAPGATVDTGFTVTPTGLAAGDVNGDGAADFVVSASDGATTPTGGLRLF